MASQSGPIHRQLGTATKRLSDRLKEVVKVVDNLMELQSKLKTNVENYEKVTRVSAKTKGTLCNFFDKFVVFHSICRFSSEMASLVNEDNF